MFGWRYLKVQEIRHCVSLKAFYRCKKSPEASSDFVICSCLQQLKGYKLGL